MSTKIISCLVCGEPIEYLDHTEEMECVFCRRSFPSSAKCTHGHYICDECHSKQGIEAIRKVCLSSPSKNPIALAQEIMENPYIYMHGPEHHVLVGAVLLTAFKNCGGDLDLEAAIDEMIARGKQVPGGICGLWGSCGAGISTGIFMSILTKANPLSTQSWSMANQITSQSLNTISQSGGPRCCKRDSFAAISTAVDYVEEHFKIKMEIPEAITCTFSGQNQQCLGKSCPYSPVHNT